MKRSEIAAAGGSERFAFEGWRGEIVSAFRPADLEGELERLIDPAAALETLHWGRNYLYRAALEAPGGAVPVVVKQFREESLKRRLDRRRRGSKGSRSFAAARALQAAGIPTPEPVASVESARPGGPSFYLCRRLEGTFEARGLLRAAREGAGAGEGAAGELALVSPQLFLTELGHLLRRMHDAGFWHRDVSVGNVLIQPRPGDRPDLYLVDLNRSRFPRRLSLSQRTRDLCRLGLTRPELREWLLGAYWGAELDAARRALFRLYQAGFEAKGKAKRPLKAARRGFAALAPRRSHAHLPPPPAGAAKRDRVVWDYLSDQPHQHAGRLDKAVVRLGDAPAHLETAGVLALAAPRIWRRYRRLWEELWSQPVAWSGVGVGIRPYPADAEALLVAVHELGVRHLLLRLHPWQEEHGDEEALARELAAAGYDLTFSLPQTRELVKDPARWRAAVAELGERFLPFGRSFQIGQAINRSKWGVWRHQEYVELARAAAEELRRRDPGVRLFGPAVIDFEPHVAAAVANLRRRDFAFDGLASLLYVDRRGAPENRQLGFDALAKALLMKAIAETARNCGPICWVTEVNWPLAQGPHSPAGRSVAVDEEAQADFLVRYYVPLLASGAVARIYWWQLVARGYGLASPAEPGARSGLERRPAFWALAHLARRLAGSTALGPLPSTPEARLFRFALATGELVVGWSVGAHRPVATLPRRPRAAFDRDGQELPPPATEEVELTPSPAYFVLEPTLSS